MNHEAMTQLLSEAPTKYVEDEAAVLLELGMRIILGHSDKDANEQQTGEQPTAVLVPTTEPLLEEVATDTTDEFRVLKGEIRSIRVVQTIAGLTAGSEASRSQTTPEIDRDLVMVYLDDIGKYPLLTKDQEIILAKTIEMGREAKAELNRVADISSMTEHQQGLWRKIQYGDEATQIFIKSNLRLVVYAAKRLQKSDTPLLDMIQQGNLGLIHAVEKFDWRKGFKFSTYALWWIRQSIFRGRKNGNNTNIPSHMLSKMDAYDSYLMEAAESGLTLSDEQIMSRANLTKTQLNDVRSAINMRHSQSLDAPVTPDGEVTLSSFKADQGDDPVDRYDNTEIVRQIATEARKILSEADFALYDAHIEKILTAGERHGSELAAEIGVSPDHVRTIHRFMRSILSHPTLGIAAQYKNDLAWQKKAQCKGEPVKLFFPDSTNKFNKVGKGICAVCPVRKECETFIAPHSNWPGLWAGRGPRERRKITVIASKSLGAVQDQAPTSN